MRRDCNLSPSVVSNSVGSLFPFRPTSLRPTAQRTGSNPCRSSQSCSRSALQFRIFCGAQSRALDIISAIRATQASSRSHTSVAGHRTVQTTPHSTAIPRRSIDDVLRFALPADRFRLTPSPCDFVSTQRTYRVHRQTPTLGSSARTSLSLATRALCDTTTYPRLAREQRDDGCTRCTDAAQWNSAAQEIDEQVPARGHRLRPTHGWADSEMNASTVPSPGLGKIKLNALLCTEFRQCGNTSSTRRAIAVEQRNCISCASRTLALMLPKT
jgi:hypothetical protein